MKRHSIEDIDEEIEETLISIETQVSQVRQLLELRKKRKSAKELKSENTQAFKNATVWYDTFLKKTRNNGRK